MHLIKYHTFVTEKDSLVVAGSVYPYKDGLGVQDIQKAKAGEQRGNSKYFPKPIFNLSLKMM